MLTNDRESHLDTRQPGQWQTAIRELVCRADIATASAPRFAGRLRRVALGPVSLLQIVSEHERGVRTRRHIDADDNDDIVMVLVRSGTLQIAQAGQTVLVSAGNFAVYDLAVPYTYSHPQRAEILAVKIPNTVLTSRVGKVGRFLGMAYSAGGGVGRLAADFLIGTAREVARIPETAAHSCGLQIADLIGIALECGSEKLPIAHSAIKSALYRRCLSFVRTQIANPDLDPELTARANGISTRYLHRIFQESGQSFGDFLRMERLRQCHRDLSDPSKSAVPIGEIAYRAGFRSQSHFVRAFKKTFAALPSEVRCRP